MNINKPIGLVVTLMLLLVLSFSLFAMNTQVAVAEVKVPFQNSWRDTKVVTSEDFLSDGSPVNVKVKCAVADANDKTWKMKVHLKWADVNSIGPKVWNEVNGPDGSISIQCNGKSNNEEVDADITFTKDLSKDKLYRIHFVEDMDDGISRYYKYEVNQNTSISNPPPAQTLPVQSPANCQPYDPNKLATFPGIGCFELNQNSEWITPFRDKLATSGYTPADNQDTSLKKSYTKAVVDAVNRFHKDKFGTPTTDNKPGPRTWGWVMTGSDPSASITGNGSKAQLEPNGYVPTNNPNWKENFLGKIDTSLGKTVSVRKSPEVDAEELSTLKTGSKVKIICQKYGDEVPYHFGPTKLWNWIEYESGKFGFITDAYVFTGTDDQVAPMCED